MLPSMLCIWSLKLIKNEMTILFLPKSLWNSYFQMAYLEFICCIFKHLSVLVYFQILFWNIFSCCNKISWVRLFIQKDILCVCVVLLKVHHVARTSVEGPLAQMQRSNKYIQRLHTGVSILYQLCVSASSELGMLIVQ